MSEDSGIRPEHDFPTQDAAERDAPADAVPDASGEESQETGNDAEEESQETGDNAEEESQEVPPHSHVLTLANGKIHYYDAADGEPNGPVPNEIDGVPVVHVAHAGEAL